MYEKIIAPPENPKPLIMCAFMQSVLKDKKIKRFDKCVSQVKRLLLIVAVVQHIFYTSLGYCGGLPELPELPNFYINSHV